MESVLKPDKKHLTRSDWADDVKGSINSFLDAYNADTAMYAVFDFDNTITVFDIEDQMLEFQIETMAFAIKPDEMERVMLAGRPTGASIPSATSSPPREKVCWKS